MKKAYCVEIIEEDWTSRYIVTGVRTEKGAIKKAKRVAGVIEKDAYIACWRVTIPGSGVTRLA